MTVLLTIAGLAPEFGGPSRSVPALATALACRNVSVEIIAAESEAGFGSPALPDARLVRTTLVSAQSRRGCWRAAGNDFFRAIEREAASDKSFVIHDNGVWLPSNHAVATAARKFHCPLIISPRGMLSEWATAHHGWKKRVAWTLYQRRNLLSATVLHATATQEAEDFRRAGFRGPIAVIPNGIDLLQFAAQPSTHNSPPRTRTALFLSRIHKKKGLLDLVKAWASVKPSGWRMLIAGNDDGGHQSEVERAVSEHQLNDSFSFMGSVVDDRKWEVYRSADLFVLPTYSENFGIVIAEALASEVPVITTKGTPWVELETHRCGWWIDTGVHPLVAALREATALSDAERREMGQRGRALVAERYTWAAAAENMIAVYRWVLNEGPRPACVHPVSS